MQIEHKGQVLRTSDPIFSWAGNSTVMNDAAKLFAQSNFGPIEATFFEVTGSGASRTGFVPAVQAARVDSAGWGEVRMTVTVGVQHHLTKRFLSGGKTVEISLRLQEADIGDWNRCFDLAKSASVN